MSLLRYLLNANKHEVQQSLNKGRFRGLKTHDCEPVCHQLVCTSGQNLLVMHGVVFDPLKMGGLCMKITVITEVLMESF